MRVSASICDSIRLNGVQVAAFNENKSKSLCVKTWSNHMAFALYQHIPVSLLSPFCHVMTFSYVQCTKFPPSCLFNILFFLSLHRVEHAPAAEWIDNLIKHTTWCTDQYPIFQFQQTNKMFQRQGEESKVCEVLTAQRMKKYFRLMEQTDGCGLNVCEKVRNNGKAIGYYYGQFITSNRQNHTKMPLNGQIETEYEHFVGVKNNGSVYRYRC